MLTGMGYVFTSVTLQAASRLLKKHGKFSRKVGTRRGLGGLTILHLDREPSDIHSCKLKPRFFIVISRAVRSSSAAKGSHLISYAQNFEDVMLARIFARQERGFYVDVGAGDPVNLSVTKWFYDQGWNGINIEPDTKLFERLAANRPRDVNLHCDVGTLSRSLTTSKLTRSTRIAPLNDILQQYCKRHIDFLRINVEGRENEVLERLDLSEHRATILVIDATVPQDQAEPHPKWEPLISGADYSLVYLDGKNRFYLANENSDVKVHFSRPPNVFDEFEPFALIQARTDAKARLDAVNMLESMLVYSDRDRQSQRLRTLELEDVLARVSQDLTTHLNEAEELRRRLAEANDDRAARLTQVEQLTALLAEANADRAARLVQIEQLTALLAEANANRAALTGQIKQLSALVTKKSRSARLMWIRQLREILARKGNLFGSCKTSNQFDDPAQN